MTLVSLLSLSAALATLRIILQRESMLPQGLAGIGGIVAAFIAWLLYDAVSEKNAPPNSGGGGGVSTTYTGPEAVEQWINEATRAANLTGVPRDLILAVIWQESSGSPQAEGSAGEQGLMQVTAVAAEDVGETLPSTADSPQRQITVGAKYLARCFDYVGGDTFKALRCYNEGPPPLRRQSSIQYATQVLNKRERLNDGE